MELSTFSFPTLIRFGVGARSTLAEFATAHGTTRPLLVTDPGLVRTDAYKLIAGSDGSVRLYDLEQDPAELVDVASLRGPRAAELARALDALPRSIRRTQKSYAPIEDDALDALRALGYVN